MKLLIGIFVVSVAAFVYFVARLIQDIDNGVRLGAPPSH